MNESNVNDIITPQTHILQCGCATRRRNTRRGTPRYSAPLPVLTAKGSPCSMPRVCAPGSPRQCQWSGSLGPALRCAPGRVRCCRGLHRARCRSTSARSCMAKIEMRACSAAGCAPAQLQPQRCAPAQPQPRHAAFTWQLRLPRAPALRPTASPRRRSRSYPPA